MVCRFQKITKMFTSESTDAEFIQELSLNTLTSISLGLGLNTHSCLFNEENTLAWQSIGVF